MCHHNFPIIFCNFLQFIGLDDPWLQRPPSQYCLLPCPMPPALAPIPILFVVSCHGAGLVDFGYPHLASLQGPSRECTKEMENGGKETACVALALHAGAIHRVVSYVVLGDDLEPKDGDEVAVVISGLWLRDVPADVAGDALGVVLGDVANLIRLQFCCNHIRQGFGVKMSRLWAEGHLSCSCRPNGAHKCSFEWPWALS